MLRDAAYMADLPDAAERAVAYLDGMSLSQFEEDIARQDATIRRLELIGEAARRCSEETKKKYPDLPWQPMIGMRNFLIHQYDDIDPHIVWETAKDDLPAVILRLREILDRG